MSERERKDAPSEHDPSAELGLKNPVRDQERLGDEKYNVTPPRDEVRAPTEQSGEALSCSACDAALDPVHSYRIDADEYVYHFCGKECYQRWGKDEGPADEHQDSRRS